MRNENESRVEMSLQRLDQILIAPQLTQYHLPYRLNPLVAFHAGANFRYLLQSSSPKLAARWFFSAGYGAGYTATIDTRIINKGRIEKLLASVVDYDYKLHVCSACSHCG